MVRDAKRRRGVALGVAWGCATAILALVGCTPAPQAPEVVTVRAFVGLSTGGDDHQMEAHRALARDFNATHESVKLEFITAPRAEATDRYLALRAAGQAPDLVLPLSVGAAAAWQDEWRDLGPLLERHGFALDDFHEAPLQALDWPARLKALPLGVYPAVLYYNRDMFERARIDPPPHRFDEPDWTYDALMEKAVRLTRDRSGKTPVDKGFDPRSVVQYGYAGTDWAPLSVLPPKFGGSPMGVSADGRLAVADSQAWKDSLAFLRDSVHSWYVRPSASVAVYGDNDPIGSNSTAMWEGFSWMGYAWGGWSGSFRWDAAAIPAGPGGKVAVQADLELAAIPAVAAHPEEAMEVLAWLARPENLKRLAEAWGCVPARKSLAMWWMEQQQQRQPEVDWQVFIDAIGHLGVPNHDAWVPAWRDIRRLEDRVQAAIVSGAVADTDKAADDLNRQIQALLDDWWRARDAAASGTAGAAKAGDAAPAAGDLPESAAE